MRRMIMWQTCICMMLMFMSMGSGLTNEEALDSAQIQEILKQERGGIIRGAHFNMRKGRISVLENNAHQIQVDSDRLTYAIKESNSGTNETIKVAYDFVKNELQTITVESIQRDNIAAIKLYRNLRNHFDMQYGVGQSTQNGKTVWSGTDKETNLKYMIICELKNTSITLNYSI